MDQSYCVVKRFSYTMSDKNSTSDKKLWSLQRDCTEKCENGVYTKRGNEIFIIEILIRFTRLHCNRGTSQALRLLVVLPQQLVQHQFEIIQEPPVSVRTFIIAARLCHFTKLKLQTSEANPVILNEMYFRLISRMRIKLET